MRARVSAGLVVYRVRRGRLELLLAHPGGPLYTQKDDGHWTIPKGEPNPGEDMLAAAIREVREETGVAVAPADCSLALGSILQKGGKIVHAWAVEKDWDDSQPFESNLRAMEWPPGSGQMEEFPEVDRAQFFPLAEARRKVKETQVPLLDRLAQALALNEGPPES